MVSPQLDATGEILFLALVGAAVVVTLVAVRLGRWPLWLLGYGLTLAALAVTFFFREGA